MVRFMVKQKSPINHNEIYSSINKTNFSTIYILQLIKQIIHRKAGGYDPKNACCRRLRSLMVTYLEYWQIINVDQKIAFTKKKHGDFN
jgi:hypothetical protein